MKARPKPIYPEPPASVIGSHSNLPGPDGETIDKAVLYEVLQHIRRVTSEAIQEHIYGRPQERPAAPPSLSLEALRPLLVLASVAQHHAGQALALIKALADGKSDLDQDLAICLDGIATVLTPACDHLETLVRELDRQDEARPEEAQP
jgi:hypothetical protein